MKQTDGLRRAMNLTTEIRIKDSEAIECFESYLKEESTILLFAIRELQKPNFKEIYKSESKFNTYLCKKFDILGRKANSIIYRAKAIISNGRSPTSVRGLKP